MDGVQSERPNSLAIVKLVPSTSGKNRCCVPAPSLLEDPPSDQVIFVWMPSFVESHFMFRLLLLLLSIGFAHVAWADKRPNIIVFYTDDHGYADLSCQGVFDDIRTPNVDRLAQSGVRVLHGYSTVPQCVPSRAGLLVGKFQSKFGG